MLSRMFSSEQVQNDFCSGSLFISFPKNLFSQKFKKIFWSPLSYFCRRRRRRFKLFFGCKSIQRRKVGNVWWPSKFCQNFMRCVGGRGWRDISLKFEISIRMFGSKGPFALTIHGHNWPLHFWSIDRIFSILVNQHFLSIVESLAAVNLIKPLKL